MSTGSRKAVGGSSNGAPGARASRTNADAARKWVQADTIAEAKEVFAQHTRETSSLDVLSRCKKLNELLSSDVLKGKGDPKAQLKEILGILHAGPKRPAFLDKPPVTATAGKRSSTGEGDRSAQPPTKTSTPKASSDDVDDVINLLNSAPTSQPSSQRDQEAAEKERLAKEAQKEAERKRKALEAEEADRKKQAALAQQEAERRRRKAQEEAERQRAAAAAAAAAEERRRQQLRQRAAVCIQKHWRGHCARRLAMQRRQQRAAERAAACVLQAAWRTRKVLREYRLRLAAACTLQLAVRAWSARRNLQRLRVEAFTRSHAARVIQRAYLAYRARYTLGPLRVPASGRPPSALGVDGAALLARQLRLRSAMDARLAPECNNSGSEDDSARSHRTVVTHMERVRQVSATERNRRCEVSERAIMVASEHRDTAEALAIARQGLSTPRTPSPSTAWKPASDGGTPDSRVVGSSNKQALEAGARSPSPHDATAAVASGLRPPSGRATPSGKRRV